MFRSGFPKGCSSRSKRYICPIPPGVRRSESAYLPSGPFKSWFDASELFAPVMHRSFACNQSYTAASYLDLMRTFSYFRLLAPERQEGLSAAIFVAIQAHGRAFEMFYETHLYLAKRAA